MERVSKFMSGGKRAQVLQIIQICPAVGLGLILSLACPVFAQTPTPPSDPPGTVADTNAVTPDRVNVLTPGQTEKLRDQEAEKLLPVFRFYPAAATEVEASLRSTFENKRKAFLTALETAARRRPLDAPTVAHPSFHRFVSWFRDQHPAFPVSTHLARIWALGESDEAIQDEWIMRLRKAMGSHICGDSLARRMTAEPMQVRMVSVTRPDATLDLQTVERWAAPVAKTNIYTLDQTRKDFLKDFPGEQEATARFLMGFLKENCFFDEALTAQIRQKRAAEAVAMEHDGAEETVVRAGQTANAKAALDLLSANTESEPERASAARQRLEQAHDAGKKILERLALVWSRVKTESRQNLAWLPGIAILLVICLWRRFRRKPATSPPARRVIGAEASYTVILNPHRNETIFLPANATLNPAITPESGEALQPMPLLEIVPVADHKAWEDRVLAAEKRAQELMTMVREGLAPHLARELMNKLVRELISQRAGLLYTHQIAEHELSSMEARFENVISQLQERLAAYERRNAELEKELAAKKEENLELIKASIVMTQSRLDSNPTQKRAALN